MGSNERSENALKGLRIGVQILPVRAQRESLYSACV